MYNPAVPAQGSINNKVGNLATAVFGIKPPLKDPKFPNSLRGVSKFFACGAIGLGGFQNFAPAAQFGLGGFQNFAPAAQFDLGGFQNFGGKHA